MATCFCGEDLNSNGECWRGMITGGHRGNCVVCGKNADLDGLRCCSEACDEIADTNAEQIALEQEWGYFREGEKDERL
jgi:hypothetical protein